MFQRKIRLVVRTKQSYNMSEKLEIHDIFKTLLLVGVHFTHPLYNSSGKRGFLKYGSKENRQFYRCPKKRQQSDPKPTGRNAGNNRQGSIKMGNWSFTYLRKRIINSRLQIYLL